MKSTKIDQGPLILLTCLYLGVVPMTFLQNIQKNFKHLFLKYTILMLFFQALLNDAYNHKGTIEILTNVGESLMQIVKVEEKGN